MEIRQCDSLISPWPPLQSSYYSPLLYTTHLVLQLVHQILVAMTDLCYNCGACMYFVMHKHTEGAV